MEQLDVVDSNDVVIGIASREECHNKKLKHRAVQIIIEDYSGRLLLQKRSKHKDRYPGLWETGVSGHVRANEYYQKAAERELKEELGIMAAPKFAVKYSYTDDEENCWISLFLLKYDGKITIDKKETEKIEWATITELANYKLSAVCLQGLKRAGRLGLF